MIAALRRRWWLLLLLLVAVVVLLGTRVATFYTDILWFIEVGYRDVFWTLFGAKALLGAVAGILTAVLLGGSLTLARRLAPAFRATAPQEEGIERYRQAVGPYAGLLIAGIAVFVGVVAALSMLRQWPTYLLWANATSFGRTDPQFGRDLGFFVFELPFYALVNSWLFSTLALVTVATLLAHYLFGGIRPQSQGQKVTPQANVHLSVLLALLAAVRAWGFRLDQFMLSYSERGDVTGLSYTDVNAQLRAYQLLLVIAAVCVVLFLANIRVRNFLLPAAGVGILVVAGVVLAGAYPAIIQRLQVDPQQFEREEPFIERNLELTRFAYGIDDVEVVPFPASEQLSGEDLAANTGTLEAVRLWDPTTLQPIYQQLQELRTFYDFRDVDVDRYEIDGETRQVNISVREISEVDLPAQARNWTNERLVYTHGFGVVSSAVSTATPEGRPVFLVEDIPPQGVEELEIDNPRIYFGENPPTYSIVDTDQAELDFPLEEDQSPAETTYDGEAGVGVGSLGRRLAFALRFAEPNILLSGLLTEDSQVLYNRDIEQRVQAVAPFLQLDHDPYAVAVGDRVQWVLDGYTTTDMVPYSERTSLEALTQVDELAILAQRNADNTVSLVEDIVQVPALAGRANYIRNSVKAVVDAYDGTITLYVTDDEDPIIAAWQQAFPESFTPLSEAPDELRAHFRYPEDMFRVQSALYQTYHIQGAQDFFQRADAWRLPEDRAFFQNQSEAEAQREERTLRPYYQLMRLPGAEEQEFALIQPFTPAARETLTALLVGGSNPDTYGALQAFRMPPTRTVEGTEQVQAIINQDDAVAEQITLWDQSGARVIRGNLLVIPIAESLLYVQPLFLRAEQSNIPTLQRVVVTFGGQVELATSLETGLQAIFGDAAPAIGVPDEVGDAIDPGGSVTDDPLDPQDPPLTGEDVDPRVAALLEQALERFEEAREALAEGDLGGYQAANAAAEELLREAEALLLGQTPATQETPTAAPEPDAPAASPDPGTPTASPSPP